MTTTPEMPFGQRLRQHRERAGKTRQVLGGLVGRSGDWVKALETGRLLTPRLPVLLRLAEVLGIHDLAELTGSHPLPVASVSKSGHPATAAIADAMSRITATPAGPDAGTTLHARVNQAWAVWHQSSAERTAVGALLPELLRDAHSATRVLDRPHRRQAHADQARIYHLAQLFLAYQPATELVWLAADRAMAAAQQSDEPTAVGAAAWYYAHVHRSAGQTDAAEQILSEAIDDIDPARGEEERAVWGQLHLGIALCHSKAGAEGKALHHWDTATQAAQSLGARYNHPWLMFGIPAVDAYRVTIEADLFHLGEATHIAARTNYDALPSRTRRAGHLIDAARVDLMRRDEVATINTLNRARRQSVDVIRHNPFARSTVLQLSARPGTVGRDARDLATAAGINE